MRSVSNKTGNVQPSQSESARQIVLLATAIQQVLRHFFISQCLLCHRDALACSLGLTCMRR